MVAYISLNKPSGQYNKGDVIQATFTIAGQPGADINTVNIVGADTTGQAGSSPSVTAKVDKTSYSTGDVVTFTYTEVNNSPVSTHIRAADITVPGGQVVQVTTDIVLSHVISFTAPTATGFTFTAQSDPHIWVATVGTNSPTGATTFTGHVVIDGTASTPTASATVAGGGTTGVNYVLNDNDLSSGIAYTGSGWNYLNPADSGTYSGDDHYSSVTGDKVTLTVDTVAGGTVQLRAKTANHHGIWNVNVDSGAQTATANLYSASDAYQVPVWTSQPLGAGTHIITFTVSGTKDTNSSGITCEVDSFAITGGTGAPAGGGGSGGGGGGTTPPVTGADTTNMLTMSGNKLMLGAKQLRTTGMNAVWTFIGGDIGATPTRAQYQQLWAQSQPNSIFRLFVFNGYGTGSFTTFDQMMADSLQYGHRFIFCLSDSANNGNGDTYNTDNDSFFNGGWASGGWRDNWALQVINHYKNNIQVAWYEMANEGGGGGFHDANVQFKAFMVANGDNHLLGTGQMSNYGATASRSADVAGGTCLYSTHTYDETSFPSNWLPSDESIAANSKAGGVPVYWGEYGIRPSTYSAGSARANAIKQNIDAVRTSHPTICAALYWSIVASQSVGTDPSRYEIYIGSPEALMIGSTPLQ